MKNIKEELEGKVWIKGDKKRVYFNTWNCYAEANKEYPNDITLNRISFGTDRSDLVDSILNECGFRGNIDDLIEVYK